MLCDVLVRGGSSLQDGSAPKQNGQTDWTIGMQRISSTSTSEEPPRTSTSQSILEDSCRSSHNQHRTAIASKSPTPAQIEKTSQRTRHRPHWFEPANPNRNPIEHPSTMSPASNTSKEAVTVGTRLFCQRPELFPKDTTRPQMLQHRRGTGSS